MNKAARRFMRFCERFQLNLSRWIPHVKPDGIYEMGTSYDSADEMFDENDDLREGTPVRSRGWVIPELPAHSHPRVSIEEAS